jgi:hypothetical protein
MFEISPSPENEMDVLLIGHQWNSRWEFRKIHFGCCRSPLDIRPIFNFLWRVADINSLR